MDAWSGGWVGSAENGVGKRQEAEKWFSLYFPKMEENMEQLVKPENNLH